MQSEARTKTFVIVPGAWDTPAIIEPLLAPLETAGHAVIVIDLPCENADATLDQYADAVRRVLPDDLSDVVLVGYSFGGFTATRVALEHPGPAGRVHRSLDPATGRIGDRPVRRRRSVRGTRRGGGNSLRSVD